MARIEEESGGVASVAKSWLARAADAPGDPAWTCDSCCHPHAEWHAICRRCGAFDKLAWVAPARLAPAFVAIDTTKDQQ
jgi:HemY protein